MGHQISGQLDFADSFVTNNDKLNQRLNKIDCLIDWTAFEKKMSSVYSSSTGRPSYPLLVLFKSLLLQAWYSLSDYALEESLDDRLSFRRFVGLSNSKKSPDHSVFSRFRSQLAKLKIYDELFEELNRQLEKLGLIIKKGTLVDATVIEAAPKKPNQNPDGSAGKSPVDKDADWTKKGGKYIFGYKAHVAVDVGSELIRSAIATPARVCDSKMLEAVIKGDEKWVYADKIYDTGINAEFLRNKAIENGIMINGGGRSITPVLERYCNRFLAKIRYPVERIFGTLKRTYQHRRARYVGLAKNDLHLKILSMAYNLRRMEKLCA